MSYGGGLGAVYPLGVPVVHGGPVWPCRIGAVWGYGAAPRGRQWFTKPRALLGHVTTYVPVLHGILRKWG
jgi:hypothetical protein